MRNCAIQRDPQVALALEMMCMLREFCETQPDEVPADQPDHPSRRLYENMVSCDVLDLAKGAALLIDATSREKEWRSTWSAARDEVEHLRKTNAGLLERLAEFGVTP